MKINETLNSKSNWKKLDNQLKQEVFAKINYAIIKLLDEQNEPDLPALIQKLANVLNENNQEKLISTLNSMVVTDTIKDSELSKQLYNISEEQANQETDGKMPVKQIAKDISEKTPKGSLIQSTEFNSEVPQGDFLRSPLQQENIVGNTEAGPQGIVNNDKTLDIPEIPKEQSNKSETEKLEEDKSPAQNKYKIDEDSGSALGIVLGRATKTEVLTTMKKYSEATPAIGKQLTYDDITITFTFNEQKIVKSLIFGKKYQGETSKGLKISDSMTKAIQLYGEPQYKTSHSCVWQEMAVFCDKPNIISSIRLQI